MIEIDQISTKNIDEYLETSVPIYISKMNNVLHNEYAMKPSVNPNKDGSTLFKQKPQNSLVERLFKHKWQNNLIVEQSKQQSMGQTSQAQVSILKTTNEIQVRCR